MPFARAAAVVRDALTGPDAGRRGATAVAVALVVFLAATAAADLALPSGLLRGSAPLAEAARVPSLWDGAARILLVNLVSVAAIALGSLFGRRRDETTDFLSVGYTVLCVLALVDGLVLGTWSFAVAAAEPTLPEKILGMADLTSRAGLWELAGQALAAAALARCAIVRTTDRHTVVDRGGVELGRVAAALLVVALLLMAMGALVEARAVLDHLG